MDVMDINPEDQPDFKENATDTGAAREEETNNLVPGSPEYLGEMAKRGGATDEEISMIVNAAQESDPNYEAPADNTDGDDDNTDTEDGDTNDTNDTNDANTDDAGLGGLTLESLSQEISDNEGKLTEDSMNKLVELGFPQKDIEEYIDSQYQTAEIIRDQTLNDLYSGVGGEDKYLDLINWASTNMESNDIKKFNTDVESKDLDIVKSAIKNLNNQFILANGQPPKRRVNGANGNPNNMSADVYRSQAQLSSDMSKPEYKKDPAFRQTVMEKLGRSPQFRL